MEQCHQLQYHRQSHGNQQLEWKEHVRKEGRAELENEEFRCPYAELLSAKSFSKSRHKLIQQRGPVDGDRSQHNVLVLAVFAAAQLVRRQAARVGRVGLPRIIALSGAWLVFLAFAQRGREGDSEQKKDEA